MDLNMVKMCCCIKQWHAVVFWNEAKSVVF